MSKVLVSSCLLGCKVRYDGNDLKPDSLQFQKFIEKNEVVSFCPEVAGGLPIPRVPAEICGGEGCDVINGSSKVRGKDDSDVTKEFLKGAELALELCQQENISTAILTDGSPSCGSSLIYNGKFEGVKIQGAGITTALLRQNGIKVVSQHDVVMHINNSSNSL